MYIQSVRCNFKMFDLHVKTKLSVTEIFLIFSFHEK